MRRHTLGFCLVLCLGLTVAFGSISSTLAEPVWTIQYYGEGKSLERGTHEGFRENGTRKGFGVFKWETGKAIYAGFYENGTRVGFGVFVSRQDHNPNEDYLMKAGNRVNDKLDGFGAIHYKNGQRYEGLFTADRPANYPYEDKYLCNYDVVYEYNLGNGLIYYGEVQKIEKMNLVIPDGYGILYHSKTNEWEVGEFSNAELVGYGIIAGPYIETIFAHFEPGEM